MEISLKGAILKHTTPFTNFTVLDLVPDIYIYTRWKIKINYNPVVGECIYTL